MLVKYYDKLLFVVGLGVLAASYFLLGRSGGSEVDSQLIITKPKDYVAQVFAPPTLKTVAWEDPKPQPAGPKWIYDLFTPPLVFLDPKTATLSPEPPKQQLSGRDIERIQFPFVLVDISRDLYRVQLQGYFGQNPDYRVTLDDRETGMPLIGKVGTRFEKSGIELKSFSVERQSVNTGGTPTVDDVATAVILDLRTGEQITLTSLAQSYLPTPKAEFKMRDDIGTPLTLRPGERKTIGDFSFLVQTITMDPKLAVVVREAVGDLVEVRKEMTPAAKEELEAIKPPSIRGGAPSEAPSASPEDGFNPNRPGARPNQPRRN